MADMNDYDEHRRNLLRENADEIKVLVDRWYEAEVAIRNVIEKLGTDDELARAQLRRDHAAAALMRSTEDLA